MYFLLKNIKEQLFYTCIFNLLKQNIKNLKYFRGSRWFESKIYNNFDFATQKYTINICQNLNLGKKLQNLKNSK